MKKVTQQMADALKLETHFCFTLDFWSIMRISWTNLLQIKQTGIDKGIIRCVGESHQHSWKMLRLTNQYDAWSLWDPRKGSVASKSSKFIFRI